MFQGFLKVCFESVCEVGFEIRQAFSLQIDKYLRAIYPKVLKDFCYVFNPFNNFVSPLHLVDNLVLGGERDGRGSSFRP